MTHYKIKCFQLDIDEMRSFFRGPAGMPTLPLKDMLKWFKEKCTVIITMERMGAVARLRGSNFVQITPPYDLEPEEIEDTTGAGDAFLAGVVASALEEPLENDRALSKALETGRLWGAHSCRTPGGANRCPTDEELKEFKRGHERFGETELMPMDKAMRMLRVFDRIFVRHT